MSQTLGFVPRGNTVAISVTASSATAQAVTTTNGDSISYLVVNPTAVAIFFAFAAANAAAPVAVVPTAGSPANGFCVPPNGHRVIVGPGPNAQVTAIAVGAGPVLVYVTPGDGGI